MDTYVQDTIGANFWRLNLSHRLPGILGKILINEETRFEHKHFCGSSTAVKIEYHHTLRNAFSVSMPNIPYLLDSKHPF